MRIPEAIAAHPVVGWVRRYPLYAIGLAIAVGLAVPAATRSNVDWATVYVPSAKRLHAGETFIKPETGYVYPPFSVMVAVPFAFLPPKVGQFLFYLMSVACAAALIRVSWRASGGGRLRGPSAVRMEQLIFWSALLASGRYVLTVLSHMQTDLLIPALLSRRSGARPPVADACRSGERGRDRSDSGNPSGHPLDPGPILPAMVWKALVILVLSVAIFGTAGYFLHDIFVVPQKRAEADAALPAPTPPPDPSLAAFAEAEALWRAGDKAAARAALAEFVEDYPDSPRLDAARALLGPLNLERLLSRDDMEGKETYTVQRGDAVAKIERRFKMPAELLMRVNGIPDPTKLSVGQTLLIVRPDFSIEIERDRQRVVLLDGGHFFKEYRPVAWNPSPAKLPDRVQTRVNDKMAWKDGDRLAFGAKGYADALRWVGIAQPGWTLYAEPPADADKANKPPHGIGLAPEDASEIASLVSWGTPVTIR